jgi:hypothetical protein
MGKYRFKNMSLDIFNYKQPMEDCLSTKKGGERLRGYLDTNNMSYADFSYKMGCSPAAICMWVNGKANPNYLMAKKMHRVTKGEIPITLWGYMMGSRLKEKKSV